MEEKLYELSSAQQLLVLGSRYASNFCIINIAVEFEIRTALDRHFLVQALNLAALRNPNNQIRLIKKDKQTYQYFSDEAQEKIEYLEFNDEDKYQKYLDNFAKTPFPNKGIGCQLYHLVLAKKPNGNLAILGCFSHFIYDVYAASMLINETLKIYKALVNNEVLPCESISPIPAYEADKLYLNSKRFEIDAAYFNKEFDTLPHFTVLNGKKSRMYPKKGQLAKNWVLYQPGFKANNLLIRIDNDFRDKINSFALNKRISVQALYCFALKVYLTLVNETNDVCFEATVNRRTTLIQRKAGGSLGSSSKLRFIFGDDLSFKEGLDIIYRTIMERFKHADYPVTKIEDYVNSKFKLSPLAAYGSMLITYQSEIKIDSDIKYNFKHLPSGCEWMPLYINIMPYNSENEYVAEYSYMPRIMSEEDIRNYHKFMIDFLNEGMNNEELSIKELIEKVGK